jgi:hypothetical protein
VTVETRCVAKENGEVAHSITREQCMPFADSSRSKRQAVCMASSGVLGVCAPFLCGSLSDQAGTRSDR